MNIGNLDVGINVNTEGLTDGLKSAGEKVSNINKLFGGFVVTLGDVTNIIQKVVSSLWSIAISAGEVELAEKKLADSMKAQNIYTKESYEQNIKYAQSLQDVTGIDEKLIKNTMQLLTTFGLHDEQLRKTTLATLNLATAKGLDLHTATLLLGKAYVGETSALTRHGIIIDETIPKTKRFAEVMRQIPLNAAIEASDTFIGSTKKLGTTFDDVKKNIGFGIIPVLKLYIELLADCLFLLNKFLEALGKMATKGMYSKTQEDEYKKLIKDMKERRKFLEEENEQIKKNTRSTNLEIEEALKYNKIVIKGLDERIEKYEELLKITIRTSQEGGRKSKAETEAAYKTFKEEVELYVKNRVAHARAEKEKTKDTRDNIQKQMESGKKYSELQKHKIDELRNKQQNAVNAYGNLLTNFSSFENQKIQENLTEKINANNADYTNKKTTLDQKYAADLEAIENSKLSEKDKTDVLSKLNEDYNNAVTLLETNHADTEKQLRDESAEAERQRRRELKPFLIAEAVANTALGVTKAFAEGGVFGFITAALIAAAGAIQISIIEAQKFAKGVRNFAGGYAIVGEEGPELAELPRGSNIYSNPETKKMLGSSSQKNNFNIVINAIVRSDEDWDKVTRNKIIPSLERYMKKTYESPFA